MSTKPAPKRKSHDVGVVVRNLGVEASSEEIRLLFSRIARPIRVAVPIEGATGRPRGFAIVHFSKPDGAARAVQELNGLELGGRKLQVRMSRAGRIR